MYREDLDLKNHLAGHQRKLMKIEFDSTQALMEVRGELTPSINRNRANAKRSDAYSVLSSLSSSSTSVATAAVRPLLPSSESFVDSLESYFTAVEVSFCLHSSCIALCEAWNSIN